MFAIVFLVMDREEELQPLLADVTLILSNSTLTNQIGGHVIRECQSANNC